MNFDLAVALIRESVPDARAILTFGGAAVSTDDVALNKSAAIERCIGRVREVYAGNPRI